MYLCLILAVHNIGILVGRAVPAQTLDMLHVYSPLPHTHSSVTIAGRAVLLMSPAELALQRPRSYHLVLPRAHRE